MELKLNRFWSSLKIDLEPDLKDGIIYLHVVIWFIYYVF